MEIFLLIGINPTKGKFHLILTWFKNIFTEILETHCMFASRLFFLLCKTEFRTPMISVINPLFPLLSYPSLPFAFPLIFPFLSIMDREGIYFIFFSIESTSTCHFQKSSPPLFQRHLFFQELLAFNNK